MKTTNTLKNLLLKGALGFALLGGFTSSAMASLLGSTGTAFNSRGAFGEYVFNPTSGVVNNADYAAVTRNQGVLDDPSFQSFCIEVSEHVAGPGVPITYIVNNAAVDGGPNGANPATPGLDRISLGTAWLYSQFATGTLDGYSWAGAARGVAASLLQEAIWGLEDEYLPNTIPAGNPFVAAAVAYFGSLANALADAPTGEYGVYVLNNTVTQTGDRTQDMLWYRAPDGGSTVMLLGLSLTGLSLVARSKRLARTA